jgi:hypothetical protein
MAGDPTRGIPESTLRTIRAKLLRAVASLDPIYRDWILLETTRPKGRRVSAVLVILGDAIAEFKPPGRDPWRTAPWMTCAIDILETTDSAELDEARTYLAGARQLLTGK